MCLRIWLVKAGKKVYFVKPKDPNEAEETRIKEKRVRAEKLSDLKCSRAGKAIKTIRNDKSDSRTDSFSESKKQVEREENSVQIFNLLKKNRNLKTISIFTV